MRRVFNRTERWVLRLSLAVILSAAVALRFAKLTFQSLRLDEHFSRHAAEFESLQEVILRGAVLDKHPPGHVLLLHFWMRWFGDSEWSLRVPGVLAGIAAVYALYRLGRTLVSERVGLITAGIAAVSQMPVYYSQDARAYVFLLLGCTLCAQGFLALQSAQGSAIAPWRQRLLLLLVASATSYLHYFGLLFVALLGLYALIPLVRRKSSFADWSVPFLGSALLYLPWLRVVMTHATKRSSWMPEPSERFVEVTIRQLTDNQSIAWFLLLAVGAIIHVAEFLRARHSTSSGPHRSKLVSPIVLTLTAWIVSCVLGAALVTYAVIPVICARNLIIILPALYLLLAIALDKIDRSILRGVPVAATLAIVGLLYQLIVVDRYYTRRTKRDYRAIAAFLKSQAEHVNESLFIAAEGNWDTCLNYYWASRGNRATVLDAEGKPLRVTTSLKTLAQTLAEQQPDVFWAVITPARAKTAWPSFDHDYEPTLTEKFVGATVRRYGKLTQLPSTQSTQSDALELDERVQDGLTDSKLGEDFALGNEH